MMLVLHGDEQREYAYGPAQGLPPTKLGSFSQALYEEAKKKNWTIISMKNDLKRVFAFDEKGRCILGLSFGVARAPGAS